MTPQPRPGKNPRCGPQPTRHQCQAQPLRELAGRFHGRRRHRFRLARPNCSMMSLGRSAPPRIGPVDRRAPIGRNSAGTGFGQRHFLFRTAPSGQLLRQRLPPSVTPNDQTSPTGEQPRSRNSADRTGPVCRPAIPVRPPARFRPRELQFVPHGPGCWQLQMAVHQAFALNVHQRLQQGLPASRALPGGQRPFRQHLRQVSPRLPRSPRTAGPVDSSAIGRFAAGAAGSDVRGARAVPVSPRTGLLRSRPAPA